MKYEEYEPNFRVYCKFLASCERCEPPRFQLFCHHFCSEVILKTQWPQLLTQFIFCPFLSQDCQTLGVWVRSDQLTLSAAWPAPPFNTLPKFLFVFFLQTSPALFTNLVWYFCSSLWLALSTQALKKGPGMCSCSLDFPETLIERQRVFRKTGPST